MAFEKSVLLENFNLTECMTFVYKTGLAGMPTSVKNAIGVSLRQSNLCTLKSGMDIESEDNYTAGHRDTVQNVGFDKSRHLYEEQQNMKYDNNRRFDIEPLALNQQIVNTYDDHMSFLPPGASKKYTLVLDLDETLVHFKNETGKAKFLIRPYAYSFLKNLSSCFEIIIFTAAQKDYADWILDKIDTNGVISHRLYREHCQMNKTNHLKVFLLGPRQTQQRSFQNDNSRQFC
jgi:hypothetical protein